jgi:hypothetical protein
VPDSLGRCRRPTALGEHPLRGEERSRSWTLSPTKPIGLKKCADTHGLDAESSDDPTRGELPTHCEAQDDVLADAQDLCDLLDRKQWLDGGFGPHPHAYRAIEGSVCGFP